MVVFLPGHTRGAITFNRDGAGDSCCAPKPAVVESCCVRRATNGTREHDQPSRKDQAECAVCHWAAGLLPHVPVVFDNAHVEQAYICARAYDAQVRHVACRLNQYGRDPPADLAV